MKKRAQLSIATMVVMLAASAALYGCSTPTGANSTAKPKTTRTMLPVEVQTVKASELAGGKSYAGAITPSSLANLASKINGKVTDLKVTVGQHVKKGQALATIDTTSLQQSLQQSESSAAVSKAQFAKAQTDQVNALLAAEKAAELQRVQGNKTVNDSQNSVASATQSVALAQAQLDKAMHDQQNSIASAKQAVATAQTSLDKARADAATAVQNAQAAVDAAQAALQNAQANASTNLTQLQQNVQQAQSSYQSALSASGNNYGDPSVQAAYGKLQSALSALQAGQGTPSSVQSAQSQLNSAQAQLTSALNSQAVQVAQQQYNQALLSLATVQSQSQDIAMKQLTQAQLALANAQSSAQGTSQTVQAQIAQSQQSLKTAQSTDQLKVSQASLAQALTNVQVLTEQLQDGTLVSPVDGIVTAINTPIGQNASATGVVSVASTDPIQATVNVPEADIAKVKVGTNMDVTVPTLGKTFTGKVLAIHPTMDATTKSYAVDVKVDDTNHELLPGMFAQATLKSAGRQAILVPADAVLSEATGNIVFVEENNRVRKVEVELGDVTSTQFEIKSGLKAGDQIVIKGEELLSDGARVTVLQPGQYGKFNPNATGGTGGGNWQGRGGSGGSGSGGSGNGGNGGSGGSSSGGGNWQGGGSGSSSSKSNGSSANSSSSSSKGGGGN